MRVIIFALYISLDVGFLNYASPLESLALSLSPSFPHSS